MNHPSRVALSAITFFLFVVFGSTMPVMSLYLISYLGFTGTQAGIILSASAISTFISPVLGTVVADRFISVEKVFSLCLIISGILMGVLYSVETFSAFLVLFILHMIFAGPTATLLNTIVFHHISDRKRDYGKIRVWGTIGWIAAGWIIGFFVLNPANGGTASSLRYTLIISSFTSIILGFATLFMPTEKRNYDAKFEGIIPISSLNVIKNKQVIILTVIMFFSFLSDRFYQYGAAPFLKNLGLAEAELMPALTLGQIPEIPAMFFLGWFISKFGLKGMVIIGSVFNIVRYSLFLFAPELSYMYLGLFFHGPAYTFVFSTIFIMLDSNCSKKDRAGVHQLFGILTGGIGGVAGSLLAGWIADVGVAANGEINFYLFWAFPLVLAVVIGVIVCIFIKDPEKTKTEISDDEKTTSSNGLEIGRVS